MHTTECPKGISCHLTADNLFVFLFLGMFVVFGSYAHALQITWGDEQTVLPYEPRLAGTTFFVPIDLVTGFGGTFEKDENVYDVYLESRHLRLWADSAQFEANGTKHQMGQPPQQRDGTLWVPLRILADHLLRAQMSFTSGRLHLTPWQPLRVEPDFKSVSEEPERTSPVSEPTATVPVESPYEQLPEDKPISAETMSDEPTVPEEVEDDLPEPVTPFEINDEIVAVADEREMSVLPDPPLIPPLVSEEIERSIASASIKTDARMQTDFTAIETFVRLNRLERPRLSVRLPHVPIMSRGMQLSAIKQTVLRAERLDWVEATVTETAGGKEAVHVAGSKPFTHNVFVLTDPARLVIDLTGLDAGHSPEPLHVNGPNIERIRMNQNAPDVVRIVLDLHDSVGYTIHTQPDGQAVTVSLHHAIRQVHTQFSAHSGSIRFDIPSEAGYEVFRLEDPDRLVIDLYDTTWLHGELPVLDPSAPVGEIRVQQFDPSRTRVVLEIDRHLDLAPDMQQDQLTFHLGHQVRGVGYAVIPDIGLVVHVDGAYLPDPQLMYLSNPERLVIDLPGTVLAERLNDAIIAGDGVAWRIRSGQHTEMVRLVLDLNSSVEYELIRLPGESGLTIAVLLPSLSGKSIFIDPGHGGHDPGAIGRVLGLREKDIVLDIALRLRDMLHAAGARAILSRETDVFVPLERRPELARQSGAEVFISIHANASTLNYEAGGTETYIYNRPNHVDNPLLASALQRHLVSTLGLINRGVKQANFAVLRNSFIPSALVEVAFVSREEEEWLLSEPWFQERVAQGLFNGIVAYFSEGVSRAAQRPPEERRRLEEGITSWLAKDLFIYLEERTPESESHVGVVQVQPL